jgi:two-component system, NarL family, nitrate/nitrite response regulator NarL
MPAEQATIRVLVADDHPVFRTGLVEAVGGMARLELVAQAENGREALGLIRELQPEVAVLDLKMPDLDGLEVMRAVALDRLPTKVLFLSAFLQSTTVYRAIEAGAHGYISKDSHPDSVCEAIVAVAEGSTVLGPEIQQGIGEEIRLRAPAAPSPLSEREREILTLTAAGKTAADIGTRLYLSPATVKTHLQRIYQKLGVSDRAAAVAAAMRAGLLD